MAKLVLFPLLGQDKHLRNENPFAAHARSNVPEVFEKRCFIGSNPKWFHMQLAFVVEWNGWRMSWRKLLHFLSVPGHTRTKVS